MSPVRSILILIAVIGGLAIAVATRLSFGTDITNLLPEGGAGSLADVSRRLTDSELARTMVLNVGGPDTATAVAGASALAELLAENPEVAWLRTGVEERQLQAIYELYFPRRHYFVAFDPGQTPSSRGRRPCGAGVAREARPALPTGSLMSAGGRGSARELSGHPRAHRGPAAVARLAGWQIRHARWPLRRPLPGDPAARLRRRPPEAPARGSVRGVRARRRALRRSARARAQRRKRIRRRD